MSNGTTTWTNTYNADGLRTKRTNGTTTYSYVYTGSILLSMSVGNDILYFNYDAAGTPLTVTYNGTTYYYATNLQGDVVAILDSTGATVVSYTYDAWGNPTGTTGSLASTLGQHNPLRYRGYVYDSETGLYYLQSRYYNPNVGRFVNADKSGIICASFVLLSKNLLSYCWNNPANLLDDIGESPSSFLNIGDYYIIHSMVQSRCKREKGWETEVSVNGPLGKGRLDLYDSQSNAYYEVKSVKAATRNSTIKQMRKYDVAKITDKRIQPPPKYAPSRGTKYVHGKFQYGFWDVEYQLQDDGLITYTTNYNWERVGQAADVVAVVAVIGAAVYLAGVAAVIPAIATIGG